MLIKALCDYYEILAKSDKVLPEGYSNVKVHYLVCLTAEGKIAELVDWRDVELPENPKGKERKMPRTVVMPERTEKPGIESNFIEHRPLYLFGLNFEKDKLTPHDATRKAQKSHQAFVDRHTEFLADLDSPVINAFKRFLQTWQPEKETENPCLLGLGKEFGSSGFAFCLEGQLDKPLHADPQVKEKWGRIRREKNGGADAVLAQCAVSGEEAQPIARTHGKIKKLYGGASTGGTLIGFNNRSDESYGNTQAYNSNVSEAAMRKYVEALNYLLDTRRHRILLDDMTVLFWAADQDETYTDLFSALLSYDPNNITAGKMDDMLVDLLKDAKEGSITQERLSEAALNPRVDFYIVGLKPNSSRIAMKFLYHSQYGTILQNIARHQNDVKIAGQRNAIELWQIKKELVSPKSKNTAVDPALMTKVLESILYGRPYPDYLLAAMVQRVKTDKDTKLNYVRAGVTKACVNRKMKKEALKMALDLENKSSAYLCGRLFAVLERAQQEASNNSLNRTIKDTYFASAMAKPALVFSKLVTLSQHHLKKVKYPVYYEKMIGGIIDGLQGNFPQTLEVVEQGEFIVGYYQQVQSFFTKKETAEEEE